MIRAYRLFTGEDGHSHFVSGHLTREVLDSGVIHFEESTPGASFDWHNAPTRQYVVTLSGVLEFVVNSGDSFTLTPGDVLIALDTTGSGHKWRLMNNEPWKRLYITLGSEEPVNFRNGDD